MILKLGFVRLYFDRFSTIVNRVNRIMVAQKQSSKANESSRKTQMILKC